MATKHRNETKPDIEVIRSRVDYCPETGLLSWKKEVDPKWFKDHVGHAIWHGKFAGKPVSKRSRGYVVVVITVDGRETSSMGHRVAWALMTGSWPEHEIDHLDTNRGNNAWSNLRECTHQENQWNKNPGSRNKSGFKGVHKRHGCDGWVSQIRIAGKTRHLGVFDSPADAAIAYQQASSKAHQSFSRSSP